MFFRAETVKDGFLILRQIFNFSAPQESFSLYVAYFILSGIVLFFTGAWFQKIFILLYTKIPFVGKVAFVSLIVLFVLKLGPDIVPPFIYFKF